MLFSILGNSGAVIPASIDTLHEKAVTCTILASTPSILATLFLPSSTINPYKLVHTILLGGETPPQSLLAAWLAQSVRILNAYGPTETMCASLMQEVEVCQRTYSVRNAIIGLPMPQCPAYVVDPATMEAIDDDDVEGEIIIAGCSLAHGYYNDLAKTSTAFVDWNGVRVYRTGDLGRWVRRNDGARVMEFRGRSDRTVKNRGFLVNLDSDVEGPIAQMREFGVDSVCAAMVQGHLVAVITPLCVDVSALYQKLRSTLSAFHVPDRIHAVDELPLSANGKVDMKAVLALLRPNHANTDGLNDSRQSGDMDVNSNSSRTARIAQCMKEALGLDQQHCLTGHSDFFELGGNSLAALRFTTLCRSQGLKVMPKDVYSAKTVIAITACANENDNVIVDVGEAALQHAGIRQAQADMLVTIAQAIGIAPSDIEAAGSLTTLQLELASSTMECDGKNTVQVRRVYDGTRAATMRSAWHRVCESEPLFRTELALHLPCGPVQILRSQARECLQPVLRVFDDYEAYHTAISQVGLVVGLGQRIEMLSYQPAWKSVEGVEDWSQAADEDMDDNTELEMTVIWTIHHALIDGYSQALVLAQVERAARGEVLVPGRSFIDAAAALTVIQEARDEEARAFWWSHLEDVVVGTPGVRPIGVDQTDTRADAPSVRATELAFTMPEHEASRIAPFARAHRTTVATLHYTAWALAQISLFQSRIVVVGAVVSGRETQPLFENVIGPTMATLPLVVRLPQDGAPSAKELLESTMGSLVSMADYAWSRPDQITRSWRLSNLLAEQYGFPVHDTEVPQARPAELFDNTAFPLNLLADGDATFRLVFDTKIHSIAAASRLRDGFIRALKALLRDDITVCLPDSQRGVRQADGIPRSLQHVLERFANGPPKTVRMAFERSAIENADLVAVESTTASLTYAELNLRAGQVAYDIRQRMPHARVVSIHADGSLNWVVGILAILKAGCAYCPLDPAYTLERRAVIHKQSGAAGLLLPYRNQSHEVPLPDLNTVIVIDEANAQTMQGAEHGVLLDGVDDSPQSDALIVFTSGTTGEPKGVPISNQGLLALQSNREATMFSQPGRRIAQFMSPAFDYCANEILSALLHGGTLVLKDPTDSLAHLKRVDAATFTPSMMAIMDPDDYPNLRIVSQISPGPASLSSPTPADIVL
jgi:non-ribosomal peptide synthetase component F